MASVVETVAEEIRERFDVSLNWTKVVTKIREGAERYTALSREMGRPVPVPSIFIDGELVYDLTPDVETLRETLLKRMGMEG